MTFPVFVYARFSTVEQSKGQSLKRQLDGGKKFAEAQGWTYDAANNLVDEGRSAFHGANRDEGAALYEFEQKVRDGHYHNGAVLIVENLDRLSRQGYEETFDLVRLLTRNGVSVATWFDNHVFKAGERIKFENFLKMAFIAERSEEESLAKSTRIKAAWEGKYKAAAAGNRQAMTRILPGWLEADPTTREIKPIAHRVKVLNEIYDWYIEGKGLPWIEKALNGRGEPNWGRGKHANKPWGVDRLHNYLTSRAVLGEFTPKTRRQNGPRSVSAATIPDYYPQVISPDKFNRAQAVRKDRKGWGGKSQKTLPNLFTGVAKCGECLGPMSASSFTKAGTVRRKKRRNGNGYTTFTEPKDKGYLICRNASRKLGCTNKTFYRYYPLEAAVLEYLWGLAMKGEFIKPNSKAAELASAVAERERLLDAKRAQQQQAVDNLLLVSSATLAQRVKDLEDEIAEDERTLTGARQELQVEMGKAPPKEDIEAVANARSALRSEDEEERYAARSRTHQSLKRLINLMHCDAEGNTMIVFGEYGAGITFDREGNCTDLSALNAEVQGPDGEANWHPDQA